MPTMITSRLVRCSSGPLRSTRDMLWPTPISRFAPCSDARLCRCARRGASCGVREGSARSRTGPAGEPLSPDARAHLALQPRVRFGRAPFPPGDRPQPQRCRRNNANGLPAGPARQARGGTRLDGGGRCASTRSLPLGTMFRPRHRLFIRCGVTPRRPRRSSDCPTRGHGRVRGWRPAMPSLGQTKEAQAQVSAILRLRPDFSTADYLRRVALLEHAEDVDHLREGLTKASLPE